MWHRRNHEAKPRVLIAQYFRPKDGTAMRIQRIAMMVLLAGLIAVPVAYVQIGSMVQGADLLLTTFTPSGPQLAAAPN